jgi:hypothetical protein
MTLLSAPIELAGDWGHMLPHSADQVVELMRHSCLDGVRLLSDRQPTRLRVDEHTSGPPAAPCQWLEEAIVEAFSLRGLGRLAENWKQHPPFAGDNAYGAAIAEYRQNIVQRYAKLAAEQGIIGDTGAWFAGHREEIEAPGGLHGFAQAASVIVLTEYERTPDCVEAVGALNRWPSRSGVPIAEYLHDWEASCVELQASPALPVHLREMLRIV